MKEIYEYLDKVKAEVEKLHEKYRAKTELFGCLKKDYNEQLLKFEEARLQIEKQARALDAQCEEIFEARQSIEYLKSSLDEKELSLKHLSSANEKLRADYEEKLPKLEGENKEMVLALDEASSLNKELKQKLRVSILKYLEAEKKAQASKELEKRDDRILKLEEDNINVLEQLKWKLEHFNHLEEAHESLQDRFQLHKEEWEMEKSVLLGDISSFHISLDSKIRISEGLQTQLDMCNKALAHEESKRKLLEVQVSELESCFHTKSLGEKSKLENLSRER